MSIDKLPHPIIVLDRQARLHHANPPAVQLMAEGSDVGDLVFTCFPALNDPTVEKLLASVFETRRSDRVTLHPDAGANISGAWDVIASPVDDGVIIELRSRAPLSAVTSPEEASRLGEALVEAGIALSSALDLEQVLRIVVGTARGLLNAKYAALGVLNAEGNGLVEFIFAGMSAELGARMPHKPKGRGILGLLISDARPIRLKDLSEHPASVGFPKDHPEMHSFLGAPVTTRGRVFGNLYVTEKAEGMEFSAADVALVQTLAAQAAVAIENAELRRERDRFFAAASHELGNAVTGARMWARLLSDHPPESNEDWLRGMRKLVSGTEHAGRLIDDLLSTSRLSERRLSVAASSVDLGELLSEVVTHFEPEAAEADVMIRLRGAGDYEVQTDAVRVRQILVNLIANALKFTPAGAHIEVSFTRVADGGVAVHVKDEGPGIAPEDLDRIFKPFEQVVGIAKGRGSGLGLPLSRQLALLLGGTLETISAPGSGSVFTLTLPAVMPAQEEGVRFKPE